MLLGFLRNRAVEDAVDIAADGRHGRFQLMRHVRDELLPALLGLLQRIRHRVERQRQIVDLARVALCLLGAELGLAVAEAARHICHLTEGAHQRPRQKCRCHQRQTQRADCRVDEERAAAQHIIRRLVHRRGHNDEAHQIAGLIVHNRLPGKKTRVVIDIGKMHVFFIVHTLAQHFAPVTLRHLLSHMVAGQVVA